GVYVLCLVFVVTHADELQEAEAVWFVVAPLARDQLPIPVAHLLCVLGAVVAQMTEAMVLANHILRGRGNARAGNPDRRMRLLDWSRPKVHHAQLIIPALPGENGPSRPGLN